MATRAIQCEGSGEESHRVHELIDGNTLQYLDVLENFLGHLGACCHSAQMEHYRERQRAQ
jgi:hypothetical protein